MKSSCWTNWKRYISTDEKKEIVNLLAEEGTDRQLDRIYDKIKTLLTGLFEKNINDIIIDPLLLIRDDFKHYASLSRGIKDWVRTFFNCCEKYVDDMAILAKNDPTALDLLETFLIRYILYVKTEIIIDLPFLVKYSSKKIDPKYVRKYVPGWKAAGAGIRNLRKNKR
ncbi:MAG: hypothetical protein MZV63_66505 [Marinilabiliales bacterium]|nr:hypothetical protein [Marinilabiliales bacterium]